MAQVNWIFLDDQGGRHRIGIYHGDRSGHLMIHCNMRVVQIDFSVKETKMYSFFVEDELCEVIVERLKTGNFGYEFRVNKKVDTPRNRIRRIDNRRNNKKLALFITGVVLVIAALFFGLRWYGSEQDAKRMSKSSILHGVNRHNIQQLAKEGKSSTAVFQMENINGQPLAVYRFSTDDGREIRESIPTGGEEWLLQNGFPLLSGDAFEAVYLPSNPEVHRVEPYRPTHGTIEGYIRRSLELEMRLHPSDGPEKTLCRIMTIAERENWTALADILFQEKTPEQNERHNRDSYMRLMRDPEVMKAVEGRCWDK